MRILTRLRFFTLRAQGYTGPMARHWVGLTQADRKSGTGLTRRQIRQVHRWGFSASTALRFGVTESNRHDFISEREYAHCAPMNGKYGKWVRDRISTLRIFAPFEQNFTTLHYHLVDRGGTLLILPLSPIARSLGASLAAVREVLATKGELELTSTLWHDPDFIRIRPSGAGVEIDGDHLAWNQFAEWISTRASEQPILLTSPSRKPRRSGTDPLRVRVIMANYGGIAPKITEAFIHLGGTTGAASAPTGRSAEYVARVDPATGEFSSVRRIRNHRIEEFTHDPHTGEAFVGVVPHWQQLTDTLVKMGQFAPQLEFVQYDTIHDENGFRIVALAAHPEYPQHFPFTPATTAFLRARRTEAKKKFDRPVVRLRRGLHNAKRRIRRDFARLTYPKGLRPYQATRWPSDVLRDLFQRNNVPIRRKLWAYRHGFLSYRLDQYGITPQNRQQFISDFEYRWLRHINGKYRYWLEDKISIKYVASRFAEHLPRYYFHTTSIDGATHLIPLMDCPPGFSQSPSEVLRLASATGSLALKPDEGSHGAGFYRLQTNDEGFLLNGRPAGAQEVMAVLEAPRAEYLVTEFIEQHPDLAAIYPDSVNTIRIVVYKPDGVSARIGATYLRIGSRQSGFVDNVAAGALVAEIDPDTGRFSGAFALNAGTLIPYSTHPDTGTPIEGTIPRWDRILATVKEIAEDIEHLEYLGFDVAVTPAGIKIPEINRFPDYPRIAPMPATLMDYLLDRLVKKKAQYGYDDQRPKSIVSLPRRP